MTTKLHAHFHSIELSLKELDDARAKIDCDLDTLRPSEVSDAIEALDEAVRMDRSPRQGRSHPTNPR